MRGGGRRPCRRWAALVLAGRSGRTLAAARRAALVLAGRSGRTLAAALAGALCAAGLAGCGAEAADLFAVERSGDVRGARLALRVTGDGRAACNRGELRDLPSERTIEAREIARDLEPLARDGLALAPGRASVLTYRVRLADGAVRFSDSSRGQPPVLFRLAKLTRDVAKGTCGLPR